MTSQQARAYAKEGKANRVTQKGAGSVAWIIRRNVFTFFNLLNLILAALLFWVGSYRNMLFMGVVVSNALIGLIQELRAKAVHDRLKLLSEGKVRVLRDGSWTRLSPSELVLGDWVRLGRGDQAPADAQVVEGYCQVDESLLTGESEPIDKDVGGELKSGCFLTEGSITARLTAVGDESYAGALQRKARKVRLPRSELMDSLSLLIRRISLAIVPLGALLYWKQTAVLGLDLHDGVTKTVAAVLGMIPEGLILLTSIALAAGAVRLGKRKALANALYGIETLARTDVVCMDKTGTLTSGAMSLRQMIPLGEASREQIAAWMAAFVLVQEEESATQAALREAFPPREIDGHLLPQPLAAIPFCSQRKWCAVQFAQEDGETLVLGAPERVLPRDGETASRAREIAAQGMRVLALAQGSAPLAGKDLPQGLRPLAFLCLQDTLRPHVRETMRYFGEEGVQLKVISGDHPMTVMSAAREAGLPGAGKAIDLSGLPGPIDYAGICEEYAIFGRVSPEDKQGLIEALRKKGHGVAMIGDGVNDIPALKAADCSIAMAGGSDAARRVAQITLLEDCFSAMPQIVLEGRRVVNNITRASALFLVKNIFSFLLTAVLLIFPFAYPFAPIQLTLIAAVTIGMPSFVLALMPSHERIQGRFLRNVLLRALPGGLMVCLLILGLCVLAEPLGLTEGRLAAFCSLAAGMTGLWVLLFTSDPLDLIRGAVVLGMTALLWVGVLCFPQVFYFVPLTTGDIGLAAGLTAAAPLGLLALTGLVKGLLGRDDASRRKGADKPVQG